MKYQWMFIIALAATGALAACGGSKIGEDELTAQKSEYRARLEGELAMLDGRIARMHAEMGHSEYEAGDLAAPPVPADLQSAVEGLTLAREDLAKRLEVLDAQTADTWMDWKAGVDTALEGLDQQLQELPRG